MKSRVDAVLRRLASGDKIRHDSFRFWIASDPGTFVWRNVFSRMKSEGYIERDPDQLNTWCLSEAGRRAVASDVERFEQETA